MGKGNGPMEEEGKYINDSLVFGTSSKYLPFIQDLAKENSASL